MGESARRRLINVRHIFVQEHAGPPTSTPEINSDHTGPLGGKPVDIWELALRLEGPLCYCVARQ
jgi:hypothetical protein